MFNKSIRYFWTNFAPVPFLFFFCSCLLVQSLTVPFLLAQPQANRDSIIQQLLIDYPTLHIADSLAISNKEEDIVHFNASLRKGVTELKQDGKWEGIVQIHNRISKKLKRREAYDRAMQLLTGVLSIVEGKLSAQHVEIAYLYDNLGTIYRQKGNYEQALAEYLQALKILRKIYVSDDLELIGTHYNIGNVYYAIGDYVEASRSNETVLTILRKHYPEIHLKLTTPLSNMGLNDIKLGFYTQAIERYKQVLQIQEHVYPVSHPERAKIASTYTSLASAYVLAGNDTAALNASQNALKLLSRTIEASHPDVSINQNIIGDIYLKRKDYEQARSYYEKALINRQNVFGEKHSKTAENYAKIGQIYLQQSDYKQALIHYQRAIMALVEAFDDKNIHANPQLKNIISETTLLKIMYTKAKILERYYNATGDVIHLKKSLETYQVASELIIQVGNLYKTYDEYESFDFNDRLPIYEDAIRVALQLHRIEPEEVGLATAFQLVEQSQYTDLMADLRSPKLTAFQGMDKSLLEEELSNKVNVTFYKEQFLEEQQKGAAADSQKLKKLEYTFRSLQASQDSLLQFFQQNHPTYYHLKYGASVQSLSTIQKRLKKELPKTAVIQYFMGDSTLYVFTITGEKADLQLLTFNFRDVIANLFDAITNYEQLSESPERAYQLYTKNAHLLYKRILKDALNQLAGQQIQHLLIIPDGILNHVPFDALLTQAVSNESINYKELPYLINDYQISYSYTASSVFEQMDRGRTYLSPYVGFGTTYDKDQLAIAEDALVSNLARETNPELNSAEREIELCRDVLGGDQYSNIQATTEHFTAIAKNYNIAHLALHTVINDEYPINSKTVFARSTTTDEDRYLSVDEIYKTPIAAELSLFSAMRVRHRKGADNIGLGLQHFINALNYAGSETVVLSLWRTDDKAALSLTTSFLKQIKQQYAVPKALQLAKQEFLQQDNQFRAHPYFWAGFMAFGNPQPLNASTSWLFWGILGSAIVVVIGLGTYFWQKRT